MLEAFLAFLTGALAWTLLEYLLHRFVFHSDSTRRVGSKEHRKHHAQGNYFAPWQHKALAAVVAVALIWPLFSTVAGWRNGAICTLGFISMYLLYEVLHRRAHTHPPRGRYGRWRRKNHFAHHFVDPRLAQGVTTPLWDFVFGTRLNVERVRVPRRLAMPWLVDENGEVHAAYAADYKLVGSRRCNESTERLDTQAAMANRRPEA